MNDLWTYKYRPKKLDNIIGHKMQKKKIIDWLKNIESNKINSLIVSGNHGIGKTTTVKLILEKFGYDYRIIYPNDIKEHRSSDNFSDLYNHKNSIYNKLSTNVKGKSKLALIINKTESITLTSEKKYIMDIYKENNKKKSFPIIFISNNQHSKLLNELKKYCIEIKFFSPSSLEIKSLIKKIATSEKMNIKGSNVYSKIINFCQFDIRRLINILQELSYHYEGKNIKKGNIDEFIEMSRSKNVDVSLFDATTKIINNYIDIDNILKLYEQEKVLLPLMIHENYQSKLLSREENWDDKIFKLMKISDSISRGDNIETSIYTDQNWYLQNIHGFYTCINTSYWINKDNNKELSWGDLKFSSDLNKTSLKNINRKNITNLLKLIPYKSHNEILILNHLCNQLLEEDRYEDFIEIIRSYKKDAGIKDMELCLKIDKTNEFGSINQKKKKRITKILKTM